MRTEGTEATSRRERLLIRREELEQLELLARSEHGVLLHRPRPQRPRGEGRHVRRVQTGKKEREYEQRATEKWMGSTVSSSMVMTVTESMCMQLMEM